ncbi:cysteine--tRNA ligase [Candidatus Curtissbacteria bacterium RBG_16_39_7]|uniref:Cysteine--tRNA ligase n=1 Tax=Candidatus Curtissbacteria bacterium RBG_16_39_7 TaxID=1797707 RepID=A0A1F5G2L6_9BACT|nr:MAG: cysteine--tRNA ligase [Candidatus Curtissbacteria bacterium RBG_16_39_7]
MRLYNFSSRKIEKFKLISKTVGLYTCGPTVYDFVHIGNLRTYIFEDILRRVLEVNGYKVKHVENITDVDDKIIKGMREKGIGISEFTKPYEEHFFEDLEKLNIKKARFYPKATQHIKEMTNLIGRLMEKGLAYKTEDGIYFDISKFPNYGKLSNLEKRELRQGARVEADEYEKENPADFALWKFKKPDEPYWPSTWGDGRPGWHIECSAMAMKYLGETIDIHCGAVDLLFPHHENEIAQSDGATGKKFVNYWLEGEHLLLSGQKMAKSLGNIVTLEILESKGFDPLAFRYLILTAHYRTKLNFTWDSLKSATNALNNLKFEVANMKGEGRIDQALTKKFVESVNDDLDVPQALAILWETVRSDLDGGIKRETILKFDQVLGLGLDEIKTAELPKGARELIAKREKFRAKGNFEEADKIRNQLKEVGVEIEDAEKGPIWKIRT